MRIKKAITLLLSVLFIVGVIAVPASATESGGEVAETMRAAICPVCDTQMSTSYSTWTIWRVCTEEDGETPITRACQHGYKYGNDIKEFRSRIQVFDCPGCVYSEEKTVYQYRWTMCEGYNLK